MTAPIYEPGGKRRQTRARLIKAAEELFAETGYLATTLDAVAMRAGMTKGAVYGNFKSKEDLFLATLAVSVQGVNPKFREGASLAEQMRILGDAVVAFAPLAERRNVRVSDLQLYIATHPEQRRAVIKWTEQSMDRVTERWRPFFKTRDLAMPLRDFVVLVDAMIDGLMIQRAMTPPLVSDRLIRAAFIGLAKGVAA